MMNIVYVIVGTPLNSEMMKAIENLPEYQRVQALPRGSQRYKGLRKFYESIGVTKLYHGAGDGTEGFVGVKLREVYDLSNLDVDAPSATPTVEQINEAQNMILNLPETVRIHAQPCKRWMVWGTD